MKSSRHKVRVCKYNISVEIKRLYSSHILLTFWPSSCYDFFVSPFLNSPLKNTHHSLITLSVHFCFISIPLYSFFISLSYPDLSRSDTDDGTRTLDPHWWRVNKPSLGGPEALLDYRPKEGWLKGIMIKRKSRGKKAWWQSKKLNLTSCFLWWHRSILLPSLLSDPTFVSLT